LLSELADLLIELCGPFRVLPNVAKQMDEHFPWITDCHNFFPLFIWFLQLG
jgi:hypothetical protein